MEKLIFLPGCIILTSFDWQAKKRLYAKNATKALNSEK